ncbi:aminotransferase-like domain-containing protein [Sulfidibacter corallicola]|nr:PLP-dependent aminotransferase family protein [Sulfidibacter corallicola]
MVLDRDNPATLTEQIVRGLRERIQSGGLAAGSRLPSIRSLAKDIQVSPMTVVKAYDQLESAGWISREHGRGTFVKERVKGRRDRGATDWQLGLIDGLPEVPEVAMNPVARGRVKVDLSNAVIGEEMLPMSGLAKVLESFARRPGRLLGHYSPTIGDPEVLAAMGAYLNLDPAELLVTSGAQEATYLAGRAFVRAGEAVVVEAPTYVGAIECFRALGVRLLQIPVDEEGLRTDLLAAACENYPVRLVYTMPSYHNPTGAVMSRRRREHLLQLAQDHRLVILEDDIWSDLYFDGPPPESLYQLDRFGHVIYTKSFSKIVSPGCRIAAVAARGPFHKRLLLHKSALDLGSPQVTQILVASFLQSGKLEPVVAGLRTRLRERYQICVEELNRHAPDGLLWFSVEGGLTLWMRLPDGVRATETVRELSYQGLNVLSGDLCYATEVLGPHVRITFSHPDKDELAASVRLLCETVARLSQRERSASPMPTL